MILHFRFGLLGKNLVAAAMTARGLSSKKHYGSESVRIPVLVALPISKKIHFQALTGIFKFPGETAGEYTQGS